MGALQISGILVLVMHTIFYVRLPGIDVLSSFVQLFFNLEVVYMETFSGFFI